MSIKVVLSSIDFSAVRISWFLFFFMNAGMLKKMPLIFEFFCDIFYICVVSWPHRINFGAVLEYQNGWITLVITWKLFGTPVCMLMVTQAVLLQEFLTAFTIFPSFFSFFLNWSHSSLFLVSIYIILKVNHRVRSYRQE